MFKTQFMGLEGWDLEKDKFSHEQLASNFRVIDQHNHSPGRGVQLSGESLFDGAIEHKQIANEAIDGTNVKEHSLGAEQIESGFLPLGTVVSWYRQSGTAEPGANWCLCDGRNWSMVPNDLGYSIGKVPDLRGRFIMGAFVYGPGTSGGSATVNLSHSHAVNAHTHEVGAHTHTVGAHTHIVQPHVHGLAPHNHAISLDGNHTHGFLAHDGNYYPVSTRLVGFSTGEGPWPNVMHIPQDSPGPRTYELGQAENESPEPMQVTGLHSHGGVTTLGGNPTTEASTGFASSENNPFNSGSNAAFVSGASTSSTDSQLGSVSIIPPYVELAYIIKVR